jgi:hypothetical protein
MAHTRPTGYQMRFFAGKLWTVTAVVAGAGVLALLLFFFAPDKYAFYPRCAFYTVTGLQCPGCGGLRCIHHLLHGRLATAFHFNALILLLTPLAVLGGGAYLLCRITGRALPRVFEGTGWIWVLVVVTVAFGLFRNLPFGHNGVSGASRELEPKAKPIPTMLNFSAGLQRLTLNNSNKG